MQKINSVKFLESINNRSIISINRDLLVFPLILTETLAEYPLIQLSFSLGLKFRNSKFSKTCKNKYWRNAINRRKK